MSELGASASVDRAPAAAIAPVPPAGPLDAALVAGSSSERAPSAESTTLAFDPFAALPAAEAEAEAPAKPRRARARKAKAADGPSEEELAPSPEAAPGDATPDASKRGAAPPPPVATAAVASVPAPVPVSAPAPAPPPTAPAPAPVHAPVLASSAPPSPPRPVVPVASSSIAKPIPAAPALAAPPRPAPRLRVEATGPGASVATGGRSSVSARIARISGERASLAALARSLPAPRDVPRALARAAGRGVAATARAAWRSAACRAALSLALFAGAVATASAAVRARVDADPRYRVSRASLAATAPPPGLTSDAIQDLAAIRLPEPLDRAPGEPGSRLSFSLFRADAVPAIAAAYGALPWVREVRTVEKVYPAALRFDLVVRRPVAGLEHGGATWLLDEDGLLLPRRCYEPSDPAALHLPVIVGAHLGRRRLHEGDRLEDLPIRHGLIVALELEAEAFQPLHEMPLRIDVSNVNFEVALNRSEVVVTAGGTVFEWGRSEAASGLNLPLDGKIANFSRALRERPLDRLSLVRLQFDQVEWRERPVAPAASPQ